MMTAHRSTDWAAPSLIHGCRAPPHPTPAGAIAPGRAGTPPRAAARLPSSPQPLLHSPHQNPAPRSRRPGNVGRMPAITRAAASASPRVSRHATPHFYTLRRPGRTLALILACVAALPASQRASEAPKQPGSASVRPREPVAVLLVPGASRQEDPSATRYHPSPVVNATPGRRRGPWLNAKILRTTSTSHLSGTSPDQVRPSPGPGPRRELLGAATTSTSTAAAAGRLLEE